MNQTINIRKNNLSILHFFIQLSNRRQIAFKHEIQQHIKGLVKNIHGYISHLARRPSANEVSEKEVLDSKWLIRFLSKA